MEPRDKRINKVVRIRALAHQELAQTTGQELHATWVIAQRAIATNENVEIPARGGERNVTNAY